MLAEGKIHFGEDETKVPCLKRYLVETEYEVMQSVFYKDGRGATKRLEQILGGSFFDHPKDEDIIAMLIRAITSYYDNREYIILDFFAGSGTTLHAVMQQNSVDGRKRKCILVTNNENGICENVTYERNKRVINGYVKPNGEAVEGLRPNNLRYYRTAFVGRDRSPQNLRKLVRLATDMLCIKEDLYNEQTEFAGQDTHPSVFRYFEHGGKRMMVIYREEYVPDIAKLIDMALLPQGEKIKVYVFSPSEDPWAGEFQPVEEKVSLCALPMAILNAYKRVLPKRRDKIVFVPGEAPTGSVVAGTAGVTSASSLFPELEKGEES